MTTLFPNEYYNKVGATTTRHIYDNTGGLIASVEGNGIATTTYFIHPDHLGGTNVVTDASGEIVQLIDYYPYGSNRLDTGTDVSQREFIGEMYDEETDLSYLNARYYSGDTGQFKSQDPVFWEVGQTQDGNAILTNPQAQNSYSYAGDNPIVNKDPTGRIIDTLADIGFITYDVYKITQAYIRGESVKEHFAALGLDTAGALIPGVTGLGMMAKVAGKADDVGQIAKQVNWGNPGALKQHTVDHAADFGLKTTDLSGYAKAADSFISNADTAFKQGSTRYDSFVGTGKDAGKTYFFDRKTNTFGVRNANGTTATAFKPYKGNPKKAKAYWERQRRIRGGN